MPPKNKFTREEIIAAAVEVVRGEGAAALTARSLAGALGASTKPIFGLFENMEEVKAEVLKAANALYQSYLAQDMQSGRYPAYKASGMGYIRFALEEKELFKLLFMRDRRGESIEENDGSIAPIIDIIQSNLSISREEAYLFHLEMWIWVHGIATMLATNYLPWDMDFISQAMTDIYKGLCLKFREGS